MTAKRRVIIHCGVQKTASTSLHHFLHRNRDALAPGLEVLTPVKGSLTRDLGRTAMRFSLDPGPELQTRLATLTGALRDALMPGRGTVLISHENLPGAMIGKGGVVTLYPRLEQILEILQADLAPLVPEFVFYTRDMAGWKNSVYNQAVKSDRYSRPLAAFLRETGNCGTWAALEQRVQASVGADRVRFFRLEDEAGGGRPGRQLLRFAGLSEAAISALEPLDGHRNQGLNTGSLEFLRQVNGLGLERKIRSKLADLVVTNQSLFVSG